MENRWDLQRGRNICEHFKPVCLFDFYPHHLSTEIVGWASVVGHSRSGRLRQTEAPVLPRHRCHPHVLLHRLARYTDQKSIQILTSLFQTRWRTSQRSGHQRWNTSAPTSPSSLSATRRYVSRKKALHAWEFPPFRTSATTQTQSRS